MFGKKMWILEKNNSEYKDGRNPVSVILLFLCVYICAALKTITKLSIYRLLFLKQNRLSGSCQPKYLYLKTKA